MSSNNKFAIVDLLKIIDFSPESSLFRYYDADTSAELEPDFLNSDIEYRLTKNSKLRKTFYKYKIRTYNDIFLKLYDVLNRKRCELGNKTQFDILLLVLRSNELYKNKNQTNYLKLFLNKINSQSSAQINFDCQFDYGSVIDKLDECLIEFLITDIAVPEIEEKDALAFYLRHIDKLSYKSISEKINTEVERVGGVLNKIRRLIVDDFSSLFICECCKEINKYYEILYNLPDDKFGLTCSYLSAKHKMHSKIIKAALKANCVRLNRIKKYKEPAKPKKKVETPEEWSIKPFESLKPVYIKSESGNMVMSLSSKKRLQREKAIDEYMISVVEKYDGIYKISKLAEAAFNEKPADLKMSINGAINSIYRLISEKKISVFEKLVYLNR